MISMVYYVITATLLRGAHSLYVHILCTIFELRSTAQQIAVVVAAKHRNHTSRTGLPDFSWSKNTKKGKIYQMTTN
jgi:hypothetical protein